MSIEIETTADGSPTLYLPDLDEHYHSVKGALAESLHVYLDLCWKEASKRLQPVRVFEVGFGTGLNAALTAHAALEAQIPTTYYSIELHPLSKETIDTLIPFQDETYRAEFKDVNDAPWRESVRINPFFTLIKIHGDLLSTKLPENIAAIYFDAFAPEKQPEMWDSQIFRQLYEIMAPGGVLSTYCAKGSIRRMLGEIGFITERLPGPPGGKREVLRVSKPGISM